MLGAHVLLDGHLRLEHARHFLFSLGSNGGS
jgi:hypothetical protein